MYNFNYECISPKIKGVTKDRFMDDRLPGNYTARVVTSPVYPKCSNNGQEYCSLQVRKQIRGNKTLLSESLSKRLNINIASPDVCPYKASAMADHDLEDTAQHLHEKHESSEEPRRTDTQKTNESNEGSQISPPQSPVDTRNQAAIQRHTTRIFQGIEGSLNKTLTKIRGFDLYLPKDRSNCNRHLHRGMKCGHSEKGLLAQNSTFISEENSKYRSLQGNYHWSQESLKTTLSSFNK